MSPPTLQPGKRLIFQENLGFCVNLLIFKMLAIKSTFKWHVSENKQIHVHVCPQQHSCPLMEKWIHKLVCPHNGMWFSHKEEILINVTVQTNSENTTLNGKKANMKGHVA